MENILCFSRYGLKRCFLPQVCDERWSEKAVWEAVDILWPLRRTHPSVFRAGWVEADCFRNRNLNPRPCFLETITGGWHAVLFFVTRFLCHLGRVPLVGPVWERPLARPLGSVSGRPCSGSWRGLQADPTDPDAIRQPLWSAHLPLHQHSRLQEVSHHGARGAGRYDEHASKSAESFCTIKTRLCEVGQHSPGSDLRTFPLMWLCYFNVTWMTTSRSIVFFVAQVWWRQTSWGTWRTCALLTTSSGFPACGSSAWLWGLGLRVASTTTWLSQPFSL